MARKRGAIAKAAPGTGAEKTGLHDLHHAAFSLIVLSLVISVAEKVLAPLYGSVAASLYLRKIAGALIVALSTFPPGSKLGDIRGTVLGGLLCISPVLLHISASQSTRLEDPILGPMLSYTPILAPIIFFATDGIRCILVRLFRVLF